MMQVNVTGGQAILDLCIAASSGSSTSRQGLMDAPMVKRRDLFEQAITELSAGVTEAFNRGDVEACAASYTKDAMMLLPDRPPVKGRDAIEAVLEEYAAAGMRLAAVDALEFRTSGGMGYCAGTYSFETSRENEGRTKQTGKFVTVFMCQSDGSWKAVIDAMTRDST